MNDNWDGDINKMKRLHTILLINKISVPNNLLYNKLDMLSYIMYNF